MALTTFLLLKIPCCDYLAELDFGVSGGGILSNKNREHKAEAHQETS